MRSRFAVEDDWHVIYVMDEQGEYRYEETPELDEEGRPVYRYTPLTSRRNKEIFGT